MDDREREEVEEEAKLTPFDKFEERMVVVSYRSWSVIAILSLLIAAFVAWIFLGSISIEVSGRGLLMSTSGIFDLQSHVQGRVEKILVEPNQKVEKGTAIATLSGMQREDKANQVEVASPVEGGIVEVQVQAGEEVKEGETLVLIEQSMKAEDRYLFYSYMPATEGNKVKKGMQAQLELAFVDPQKVGYLMGKVVQVSDFPVTESHLYSVVHNRNFVEYLTGKNPAVIEVIVEPEKELSTASGYRWSSAKGPAVHLRSGLVGSVRITVERRRPISYLFPEWLWLPENLSTDK